MVSRRSVAEPEEISNGKEDETHIRRDLWSLEELIRVLVWIGSPRIVDDALVLLKVVLLDVGTLKKSSSSTEVTRGTRSWNRWTFDDLRIGGVVSELGDSDVDEPHESLCRSDERIVSKVKDRAGRRRERRKGRTVLRVREVDLQDRQLSRDLESSDVGSIENGVLDEEGHADPFEDVKLFADIVRVESSDTGFEIVSHEELGEDKEEKL